MKYKPLPSQETLQHLFDYDPEEGLFYWRNPRSKNLKPGDIAGTTDKQGYRIIRVEGCLYKAHRLAWMYVYGEEPGVFCIDHINCVTNDNRISNLRLVTKQQNNFNISGTKGYTYHIRDEKYAAHIAVNGIQKSLGYHDTKEQARQAYLDAKQQHHIIN